MPSRILRESLLRDELIDRLSCVAEVTYFRLLLAVDDFGNIDARPSYLKSMLYPTKRSVTEADLEEAREELLASGLVWMYQADGAEYLHCEGFEATQKLRYPTAKFPRHPREGGTIGGMGCRC